MPEALEYCVFCGKVLTDPKERYKISCAECKAMNDAKRELIDAAERACLWCDSDDVAPIVYGAPGPWLHRLTSQRKAVWGGCIIDGYEPKWHCMNCGREWGRPREVKTHFCNSCGRPSDHTTCGDCELRQLEELKDLLKLYAEDASKILIEASETRERSERSRLAAVLLSLVILTNGRTSGGSVPAEAQ